METYEIRYYLRPDAEDIVFRIVARSDEEATIFAKEYRRDAFGIRRISADGHAVDL